MKIVSVFTHIIVFSLVLISATVALSGEPEIDPSWKKHKVIISFIDPEKRLFVASDREFFVPFNTAIYNHNSQPIALLNLQVGHKIWLYLDSKNSAQHKVKRIEKTK